MGDGLRAPKEEANASMSADEDILNEGQPFLDEDQMPSNNDAPEAEHAPNLDVPLIDDIMEQGDAEQLMAEETGAVEGAQQSEADAAREYSRLEQVNFNLSEELAETKRGYQTLSATNQNLQAQLKSSVEEMNQRVQLFRQLESMRDDLVVKKAAVDQQLEQTRRERDERDAQIRHLNGDNYRLNAENVKYKEELRGVIEDKAALLIEKKTFEEDKRQHAYERDKAASERAMHAESKKWLLNEVADKNNKIAQMRIETSTRELEWQSERSQLVSRASDAEQKARTLEEKLEGRQATVDELNAKLTAMMEEHRVELEELEAELVNKDQLYAIIKESLEKAEELRDEALEVAEAKQTLYNEAKQMVLDIQKDIQERQTVVDAAFAEKDAELANLRDELAKAEELIKQQHGSLLLPVGVSDADVSMMSPTAEAAKHFLRGGTLTSAFREHVRMAGELAEEKEKARQLEDTLKDLVAEIEERAPGISRQRAELEAVVDQSERLEAQLKQADQQRVQLESKANAAVRELAFTRAELERYQRDQQVLSKQVQHLTYVLERGDGATAPGGQADRQLFSSIAQLQSRNTQLESELASERAAAKNAVRDAHNAEAEKLRGELDAAKANQAHVANSLEKLQTVLHKMEEQRDTYKRLAESASQGADGVSPQQIKDMKEQLEEQRRLASEAQIRAARLEQSLEASREERKRMHELTEERVAQQTSLVSDLKKLNGKLEAAFELQKQTAVHTKQELDAVSRAMEKTRQEVEKARAECAAQTAKLGDAHRQMLEMQDTSSMLKVENRSLSDEASSARAAEKRLTAEIAALRTSMYQSEQMMSSLREMELRMGRMEAERQAQRTSQLEAAVAERDQLRASSGLLNDQLRVERSQRAAVEARLAGEVQQLKQQLLEARKECEAGDRALAELRNQLSAATADYSSTVEAMGGNPERLAKECQQLKNRNQYLEKQLEEMKESLSSAEQEACRRGGEAERAGELTENLEKSLKETSEMSALERERLEAQLKTAEETVARLRVDVCELRESLAQRETEMHEADKNNEKERFSLAQEIAGLESRVSSTEAARIELDERVKRAAEEEKEMRARLEQLEADLSRVSREAGEAADRAASLEQRLALSVDERKMEKEAADASLAGAAGREASMRSRVAELEEQLAGRLAVEEEMRTRHEQVYEQVVKLSNEMALRESEVTSATEGAGAGAGGEHSITSLNNVIGFLREEKKQACERAMYAEVEMRRLRSETNELAEERDRVMEQLRTLQAEVAANAVKLTERLTLLEKLQGFEQVQMEVKQLREERTRLQTSGLELQQRRASAEAACQKQRDEIATLQQQVANLNVAVESARRELEVARGAVAQAKADDHARLSTELESQSARVAALESEKALMAGQVASADQKSIDAEKKLKAANEQMAKVTAIRQLAVKYKNEVVAVKKELSDAQQAVATHEATIGELRAGGATAAAAAAATSSAAAVSADAAAQLAEMKKAIEAAEERAASAEGEMSMMGMRMKMLETQTDKQKKQLEDKDKESIYDKMKSELLKLCELAASNARLTECERSRAEQAQAAAAQPVAAPVSHSPAVATVAPTQAASSAPSDPAPAPLMAHALQQQQQQAVQPIVQPKAFSTPLRGATSSSSVSVTSASRPVAVTAATPVMAAAAPADAAPKTTTNVFGQKSETSVFGQKPTGSVFGFGQSAFGAGSSSSSSTVFGGKPMGVVASSAAQQQHQQVIEQPSQSSALPTGPLSVAVAPTPQQSSDLSSTTTTTTIQSHVSPRSGSLFGNSAPKPPTLLNTSMDSTVSSVPAHEEWQSQPQQQQQQQQLSPQEGRLFGRSKMNKSLDLSRDSNASSSTTVVRPSSDAVGSSSMRIGEEEEEQAEELQLLPEVEQVDPAMDGSSRDGAADSSAVDVQLKRIGGVLGTAASGATGGRKRTASQQAMATSSDATVKRQRDLLGEEEMITSSEQRRADVVLDDVEEEDEATGVEVIDVEDDVEGGEEEEMGMGEDDDDEDDEDDDDVRSYHDEVGDDDDDEEDDEDEEDLEGEEDMDDEGFMPPRDGRDDEDEDDDEVVPLDEDSRPGDEASVDQFLMMQDDRARDSDQEDAGSETREGDDSVDVDGEQEMKELQQQQQQQQDMGEGEEEEREAASAVEEADDESRSVAAVGVPPVPAAAQPALPVASASQTSTVTASGQPAKRRVRQPIVYEATEQCSSSQEAAVPAVSQASQPGRQTARRGGRGAVQAASAAAAQSGRGGAGGVRGARGRARGAGGKGNLFNALPFKKRGQ